MKLLSWAHRKLLSTTTSLRNHRHNAEISTPNVTYGERSGVQARAGGGTHAEVLTIGTLGLGNLLRREEEEKEDEKEEEEEAPIICGTVDIPSPNRQSSSSNCASASSNRMSTSSNRASSSSNRESVSSVDIQKLQDELQKILYFKLGEEDNNEASKKSNAALEGNKAKRKKQTKKEKNANGCYINDMNAKPMSKTNVPSERGAMRGVLPLHNFLEMPMDHINNTSTRPPSYKLLSKTQYLLLMQTLKSKLLHYTSPTRVKFSSSLFENLVKPRAFNNFQHGSTMNKMLHLFEKLMSKRPSKSSNNGQKGDYESNNPKCIRMEEKEEEEQEEERLKWALDKSYRGSDRFINYIASTMAQLERDKNFLVNDKHLLHHHIPYQFCCEKVSCFQLMPTATPFLDTECWIDTDEEYFVLEL